MTGLFLPLFPVSAGTILSPYQYAWSDASGYINFANVDVSDGALSGYAWSANFGWIKFNPAQGGVLNDGTGNLSGSAWGEQLGWIDFDNVLINTTSGKFSGTATGELVGTITFDCPSYCDVRTDWKPAAVAPPPPPTPAPSGGGGGGGSGAIPLIKTPPPKPAAPVQEPAGSAQARLIDFQKDGVIDILDINTLMVSWGRAKNPTNAEGALNADIISFNTLMVYWGTTYPL